MKIKIIGLCSLFLLLFSCDIGTAIIVYNGTEYDIIVECKTIYDDQSYNVEMNYGQLKRYVRIEGLEGYNVLAVSLYLKKKGEESIFMRLGSNLIAQLGLGTIDRIDDVVAAIDTIFIELNVYVQEKGDKVLLYDKNYFLDKENIAIKSGFIRINIK
jgi:hypothetical protein